MRALLFVLVLSILVPTDTFADTWSDFAKELEGSLKGKTYYLRETYNSSPKVYCHSIGIGAYYFHEKSKLFPPPPKEPVVIEDIRSSEYGAYGRGSLSGWRSSTGSDPYSYLADFKKSLQLTYRHKHLGKGSIRFFDIGNTKEQMREDFYKILHFAFSKKPEDDFLPFVGNEKSKMLHFVGCNHLPNESLREGFRNIKTAEEKGYKKCSLCFRSIPRMPDYELEMLLKQKVTAEVRYLYPLSDDAVLTQKVRACGESILANWPTSLRRYKYSFDVVNSDICNAIACPGGAIFVTTGLLNILESNKELEAALAHEITHIERRHGLRLFKKAQSSAFWAGIASIAAVAAVGATTKDATTGYVVADLLLSFSALATQIVLTGYSKEYEQEADFYAISYLKQKDDDQSMRLLLRKLEYYSNLHGNVFSEETSVFASHPNIEDRITYALNAEFRLFPEDCTFTGYSEAGDVMAQVRIESQCLSEGMLKVFATIQTTSAMEKEHKIKSAKLYCNGREYKVDNKEDTVVFPNDEVGCTFEAKVSELIPCIDGIKLDFGNVKSWTK